MATRSGVYDGLIIRETAGATALVKLYDNPSANSGTLVDIVSLAANGVANSIRCVRFQNGLYVDVVSGAVEGTVFLG